MVVEVGYLQGAKVVGLAFNLLWLVMKAHLVGNKWGYLAPVCADCFLYLEVDAQGPWCYGVL